MHISVKGMPNKIYVLKFNKNTIVIIPLEKKSNHFEVTIKYIQRQRWVYK